MLRVKDERTGKTKTLSFGFFDDPLEAAKVMNYKCVENGLPLKNPSVGILPPKSVTHNNFFGKAFGIGNNWGFKTSKLIVNLKNFIKFCFLYVFHKIDKVFSKNFPHPTNNVCCQDYFKNVNFVKKGRRKEMVLFLQKFFFF